MDYARHYQRLIDRARDRKLDGYTERHHVIPRCMGGADARDNLVRLTAEEHYVAHQLLIKIYPRHIGLAHAAVKMAKQCTGNKPYGWLRRRHASATSVHMKGNRSWTGRKHTAEWRAARSAEMLGKKMPRDGVEKMAASKRGKPLSPAHRDKLAKAITGKKRSLETKMKISAGNAGKVRSAEHKLAVANANRGRVFSQETRVKMSMSRKAFVTRSRLA